MMGYVSPHDRGLRLDRAIRFGEGREQVCAASEPEPEPEACDAYASERERRESAVDVAQLQAALEIERAARTTLEERVEELEAVVRRLLMFSITAQSGHSNFDKRITHLELESEKHPPLSVQTSEHPVIAPRVSFTPHVGVVGAPQFSATDTKILFHESNSDRCITKRTLS